jgi:enoyl-CoA hydratase
VARDESIRQGAQIIEEMLRFPLPVIAAVNGAAVGLGCSLAVLCDIVLISETAHLADPHVTVGLVAGDGGAAFWPLLTPLLRSREYLYTGDRIPAATAVELGLATRAVAPGDLLPEARRLAERMAGQPAEALQATKRVLNMHLSQALSGALQAGFAAEAITMRSAEHRERLLSLRGKARRR